MSAASLSRRLLLLRFPERALSRSLEAGFSPLTRSRHQQGFLLERDVSSLPLSHGIFFPSSNHQRDPSFPYGEAFRGALFLLFTSYPPWPRIPIEEDDHLPLARVFLTLVSFFRWDEENLFSPWLESESIAVLECAFVPVRHFPFPREWCFGGKRDPFLSTDFSSFSGRKAPLFFQKPFLCLVRKKACV